ncbi:hypothetical protein V2G26_015813 [Clonostachys chloroleuca]
MLTEDQLRHSEQALVKFRQDDALSEMLDDYAELIRDYSKLKAEYEEARESRERYKKLSKGQDLGQYVLVLVDGDGDGYHFQDDFVRKGANDGGGNAARALNEAVKQSLKPRIWGTARYLSAFTPMLRVCLGRYPGLVCVGRRSALSPRLLPTSIALLATAISSMLVNSRRVPTSNSAIICGTISATFSASTFSSRLAMTKPT